jgi:hypothetical protein
MLLMVRIRSKLASGNESWDDPELHLNAAFRDLSTEATLGLLDHFRGKVYS